MRITGLWVGPFVAVAALVALATARPLAAQNAGGERHTLVLQGVPLGRALEEVAQRTGIDLVYSAVLVDGQTAYCAARGATAEELLRCVLTATRIDFVRSSSGTYILLEARRQEPAQGHLAGSIIDEATGAPLPFANVMLADAAAGTTTNEDGLFGFAQLMSGMHRIVVTYVGYQTRVDTVWVRPGVGNRLQIQLRPDAIAMDPIVVSGLEQRLPSRRLGAGERVRDDLADLSAIGTPDVVRGAAFLTGVSVQQPLADLHIQGGASGEHLTLLDGVPIRNPVSLGRHLGAFSPLAIERMNVHKAGFGVQNGSHLSGVVHVEHDLGDGQPQGGTVTLDPVSVNGKVGGRFVLPGARTGAFMATVRSSAWDFYQDPSVRTLLSNWHSPDPVIASRWIGQTVTSSSLRWFRNDPVVVFSDVHAALRLNLSPFRVLNASLYHATNDIRSEMRGINDNGSDEQELMYTNDDYAWTNWAAQLRHSWILGSHAVASMQGWGSWHDSRYAYQALHLPAPATDNLYLHFASIDSLRARIGGAPGSEEGNAVREVGARAQLSYSVDAGRQLDIGLEASHTDSRFRLRNPLLQPFRYGASSWELAGFLASTFSLGYRTTLEAGLRATYLPVRRTVYGEPRATLRYDADESPIGAFAARLSGGLYRQFTNQFELTSTGATAVVPSILFWLPIDRSLAPPRVFHLAADLLVMPAEGWTLQLESYLKAQPRLVGIDYVRLLDRLGRDGGTVAVDLDRQSEFISPMRGRSFGGSVSVERDADWGTLGAGYSYSRALRRYPGRFAGALVSVPWNEPHRVDARARVPLLSALSVTVAGHGSWGRRWALRRTYYDFLALGGTPFAPAPFDLDRPSGQTVSPYLTFDLGLTYEQRVGATRIRFRAFVLNLYDRENVYDYSLEADGDIFERVPRLLPGRQLVLSLRLDV